MWKLDNKPEWSFASEGEFDQQGENAGSIRRTVSWRMSVQNEIGTS